MSRKLMILMWLICALCLTGWLNVIFGQGKGEQKPAGGNDAFADKVIAVYTNSYMVPGGVLTKVEAKQLRGRSFLVGKSAGNMAPEENDRTVWIALDAVISIVEFKDVKEAKTAYEKRFTPGAVAPPAPMVVPAPPRS